MLIYWSRAFQQYIQFKNTMIRRKVMAFGIWHPDNPKCWNEAGWEGENVATDAQFPMWCQLNHQHFGEVFWYYCFLHSLPFIGVISIREVKNPHLRRLGRRHFGKQPENLLLQATKDRNIQNSPNDGLKLTWSVSCLKTRIWRYEMGSYGIWSTKNLYCANMLLARSAAWWKNQWNPELLPSPSLDENRIFWATCPQEKSPESSEVITLMKPDGCPCNLGDKWKSEGRQFYFVQSLSQSFSFSSYFF